MPTTATGMRQAELFAEPSACALPGLKYEANFLTPAQEFALLDYIRGLDLKEAQYRQWRANRRTVSYGGRYDFTANELLPAAPLPSFLFPLRERIAAWVGIPPARFNHALIAEYRSGTQLGWHRDMANFESVVGVSLAGAARMRFRPYPPLPQARRSVCTLALQARSVYALRGHARWDWQHAVSPAKMLRYSITFRTLADKGAQRSS
jgi:alkylated DNA repair dioxygenase AlkB